MLIYNNYDILKVILEISSNQNYAQGCPVLDKGLPQSIPCHSVELIMVQDLISVISLPFFAYLAYVFCIVGKMLFCKSIGYPSFLLHAPPNSIWFFLLFWRYFKLNFSFSFTIFVRILPFLLKITVYKFTDFYQNPNF